MCIIPNINLIFGQGLTHMETVPLNIGIQSKLYSKILDENQYINVYLPYGYNPDDSLQYPVVYLLDGAIDEDFIHITGLFQFCSFDWIGFVPKSIIIGIVSNDRRRDYTSVSNEKEELEKFPSSGNSKNFIMYLAEELQPYIKENFKTNNYKTLIGQSLGGLLATEILFNYTSLFSSYFIVSPSLWWNDASLLKQDNLTLQNFANKLNIYLAVGKEGLTPTKQARVMEVDVNLLKEKIDLLNNKNFNIYFDYLPNENHATILHQAIYNALRIKW
jgi:uncharacterized protein